MADYPDVGSLQINTSFTRPHSGGREFLAEPGPRDRYSRRSGQTQHHVRDVTWISTTQPQPNSTHAHTPQTPWYAPPPAFQQTRTPTPVFRKSAPTITESEIEAEYMTVSVDDPDEGNNYQGHAYGHSEAIPAATNGKSEKKSNFVGGLLRRLPKVMSKSRLRDHWKPERQGTNGTAASTVETGRTTVPRYTAPMSMPLPGIAASGSDVPTVERLETPPRASSVSPHATPGDSDGSITDGRRERLVLSAVREHEFQHGLRPSLHAPHPHSRSDITSTSTSSRPPFIREGDLPNAMSTPILADASIRVSSPVLAEPRPSADFMKMDSPIRPPPAESVRSQIARAGKFVRDINKLPWIASSGVSSIYVPGEATTRRYSRPIHKNKGSSWYTSRPKHIDLFAGPSTTGLLPVQTAPSGAPGLPPPVVPAPFILGSSANLLFSPPMHVGAGGGGGGGGGGSGSRSPSHEGPPSSDSHGSQAQVLAPAYVAQPLFVYPSGLPQPGGPPEAQLPRPVYMLANSPPQFMSQMDGGMGSRLYVPQQSGLRTPTFG